MAINIKGSSSDVRMSKASNASLTNISNVAKVRDFMQAKASSAQRGGDTGFDRQAMVYLPEADNSLEASNSRFQEDFNRRMAESINERIEYTIANGGDVTHRISTGAFLIHLRNQAGIGGFSGLHDAVRFFEEQMYRIDNDTNISEARRAVERQMLEATATNSISVQMWREFGSISTRFGDLGNVTPISRAMAEGNMERALGFAEDTLSRIDSLTSNSRLQELIVNGTERFLRGELSVTAAKFSLHEASRIGGNLASVTPAFNSFRNHFQSLINSLILT